jgi:hypothetical protein
LGFDFLKAQAEKHRKACSARYEAAARDMLSRPSGSLGLKVAAQLRTATKASAGERVLLVSQNQGVYVCRENLPLAEVKSPPAALQEKLHAHCGVLPGEIEELHARARAISVRVLTSD